MSKNVTNTVKSKKLTDELDAFLGFPNYDPHGDPIPDKDGNIEKFQKIFLSQINQSVSCFCVGVKDSSASFLKYLDKYNIALGSSILVLSKESFDGSMTVKVNNSDITISKEIANNIKFDLSKIKTIIK